MTSRAIVLASAASLALVTALVSVGAGSLASAQERPESLLPPGFDDPAPTPSPTATPTTLPTAAPATPVPPSTSGVDAVEISNAAANLAPLPQLSAEELANLPTLEELEELSYDELDDLLGLGPQFDIPPAARRSLSQVGLLTVSEGGLPTASLRNQPQGLVRAILAGTKGPFVSRWGHILVRRALASRMRAPQGMSPVEFAALRAGVLNSMGEFTVNRSFVQDVDTGNWNTALTSEALTAYIATSDLVGACPAVRLQGSAREDARWVMMQAICNAYAGEGALAGAQLDAALGDEIAPAIDILLAQRYAGAAGRGRRGVSIDWDNVSELNPWRFALANAVGETIPDALAQSQLTGPASRYYALAASATPMLPLVERAGFVDFAASEGVLSSRAMVDLYSQIYAQAEISSDAVARAGQLREAYVAGDAAERITAMQAIWSSQSEAPYSAKVLTAYAAARITPSATFDDDAENLIASMLTAGLDRDAASWMGEVESGSPAWALIALSDPEGGVASEQAVDGFVDDDDSTDARRSAFLVAGLSGLGRLSNADRRSFANRLDIDFVRQTRWTQMIEKAAEVENRALVAFLVGLGMQGDDWSQMTPLYLFHITSALRRVGLEAEARMIAAEAVARG